MSRTHASELWLSLCVLKLSFGRKLHDFCSSAHIAEGIVLSFQMDTFCNVGLFVPIGCRSPSQSIVLPTQNRLIRGITVEYTPKKVFVLEGKTYLELSYAEFREQKDTYQGRRFIPLHGMLMEVSEAAYKAFYKDKRRQKYLNERSDNNGDFSYDMLTTDEFNGEDILVDELADTAGQAERNLLLDKLRLAIASLSEDERQLLDALYYQGLTERDWSAQSGIPQKTINDRKKRLLIKLQKIFEK